LLSDFSTNVVWIPDDAVVYDRVVGRSDSIASYPEEDTNVVTVDEVEAAIIECLSEDKDVGLSPEELREHLEGAGPELPIDSVLAAEMLPALEERFGVRLPANFSTAYNLRSVQRLARQVAAIVYEQGHGAGETA
jgi:acyl carrier protein